MYWWKRQERSGTALVGCMFLLSACSLLPKGHADFDAHQKAFGWASWYGEDFQGRLTASGEPFAMNALTAAHRTFPFGTVLQVTNLHNGRWVQVRINDRGPYVHGRILDLSYAAAEELGMLGSGISAVHLTVVHQSKHDRPSTGVAIPKVAEAVTSDLVLRAPHEARWILGPPEDVWLERRPRHQFRYRSITSETEWPI